MPKLQLRSPDGNAYVCLPGHTLVLGRPNPDNPPTVPCDDETVSHHHCEVLAQEGKLKVIPLSKEGTFINGRRVDGAEFARQGDWIVLGPTYTLRVEATKELSAAGVPKEFAHIAERYRLHREIAKGGMGVVYEGTDEQSGSRCAVKILKGGGRPGSPQEKRFKREASLGERLGQHPGIVFIYDSGALDTGDLYCVMEFVEGESLDKLIAAGRPRDELLQLVVQVSRAVGYAHERGVIHRDLKPQNVLVTPDGQARLTDFGVAKALDDIEGITATGAVMGTLCFMAPEQIRDSKRVDARSDVYGLGGVLYQTLTGREPLQLRHLSMREALLQVLDTPIVPVAQVDASIDPALNSICMSALGREPTARPASAGEFADRLEAYLQGDRTEHPLPDEFAEPPDPDEQDSSGVALLVMVGIAAIVFIGVVAFVALR